MLVHKARLNVLRDAFSIWEHSRCRSERNKAFATAFLVWNEIEKMGVQFIRRGTDDAIKAYGYKDAVRYVLRLLKANQLGMVEAFVRGGEIV